MNLVDGKIINAKESEVILDSLSSRITETLKKQKLEALLVVEACDELSRRIDEGRYINELTSLGVPQTLAREYMLEAKSMLGKEYLLTKLTTELGDRFSNPRKFPTSYGKMVEERIMPLGVLFHIAAGNTGELPVFTVIEGLLAGNINLLKLPAEEGGISVKILQELILIEPRLSEYIYVFDYSSRDIGAMEKLAALADAIVIWGGDDAVSAVRKLAKPNTKIIEWGHKLSFAYVTKKGITHTALKGIALNMCETNQLLCSSCQGIFVDTESMDELYEFCERFIPVLNDCCKSYPAEPDLGIQAQVSLKAYRESLEAIFDNRRIFNGDGCSIAAYANSHLEPSIMFRNCWAKRLPRLSIIESLRPYKNYLQTIALICEDGETEALTEYFWKTGAVRITDGFHMSKMYTGMPHDGEYPLRRYTKIVSSYSQTI